MPGGLLEYQGMALAQGVRTQQQQNNSQGEFKLLAPRHSPVICAESVPLAFPAPIFPIFPSIQIQDPVGNGGQLLLMVNLKDQLYFEAFKG